MNKGKAFVVVGHSNWGKSETLRALTNGNWRIYHFEINGVVFRIKRMSNDDIPDSLISFLKRISAETDPVIIITLCPDFNDDSKSTSEILNLLSSKYEIYFWIIRHAYNSNRVIGENEIDRLREIGAIHIFEDVAIAELRSNELKKYLLSNL